MNKLFCLLGAMYALSVVVHTETSAAPAVADAAFSRLADDYIAGFLAWRPQTGTALGFHEYDGKITDYTRASVSAELARLKSFERRLAALDAKHLSQPGFYDYRILRQAIQREIFSFTDLQTYTQNPMTYAGALDVSIYVKRDFAPLEDRVHSLVTILNQAPNVMAAARANLDESLPRPQVETAIEIANGAADFLAKDLIEALKELKNESLRSVFTAVNERAIAELRGYANYLKDQKLPKAHNRYALGRKKFARMLLYGEMISVTPERLLKIGLSELRREQASFKRTAALIDPGKDPVAVFKAIQADHPTEQTLIPDTRKDMETIRQFLITHRIISLPSDVRARVEETPQFMRATSFASMDTPGPFETKATEAYYYVTPVEKNWPTAQKEEWLTAFNYYTTDVVSIHEAYPGHFIQFLCLNASPATKLEKIFNSYAFIEGWAHYAEQMMLDEGFGGVVSPNPSKEDLIKAAKYRLAQSDEALLRICRFCVSIKMHCLGMTVEEAAKFFEENCYYAPKPARQEAIRGAYDPEYLYYTLGKLEFLKLRQDYRKEKGDAFALRTFHDELLRHGAPPIRLLREVMLSNRKIWNQVF